MLIFILGVGTPVFSSKLGHCLDNYFAFLISSWKLLRFFAEFRCLFFLGRSLDYLSDTSSFESRQMTGDRFVWGERIILSGFCLSIIVG